MVEASQWPPAVEVLNARGGSSVVLLCPHASNHLPAEYHKLGLAESDLERHIAWDIGAAAVTHHLSELLDAPAFLGTYSRLLIDLNRPIGSASSIVTRSEGTDIAANTSLSAQERSRRAERIFFPYHTAIRSHLQERADSSRPAVIVAIHSFTPVYHDVARPWHAGVLFEKSAALAQATIQRLREACENINVGANVPYTVTRESDFALLVYGDDAGNPAIEFEVRQDLIAQADGQRIWAKRIADALGPVAGRPPVSCSQSGS